MRHRTATAALALALGAMGGDVAVARAQMPAEVTVSVGLYLQIEAQYSSVGTDLEGRTMMDVHRARPLLALTVNDWITARLEPDFGGGRVRARNAYIQFDFDDAAQLSFGQFKKPFGLIQRTSSSMIPVIQRPVEILGLQERVEERSSPVTQPDGTALLGDEQTLLDAMGYQGYALGVALGGTAGAIEYSAGVFEGPWGTSGRSGAAARASYAVIPGLKFGAAVSHSRIRFEEDEDARTGTAGALEVAFGEPGWPGFGALAEVVRGRGVGTGTDFAGGHVIGWLHRGIGGRVSGIEPVVRVSWGDPDTDTADDGGTLLTAGFNIYFGGRNRLMFDWDVYTSQDDAVGTETALRAQAQVRF